MVTAKAFPTLPMMHSAHNSRTLPPAAMFQNYNSQVTVLNTNDVNSPSNKKFLEETGIFFSDPNFFSVFHYKWLAGSAQVLKNPNTAVITKKMAEKYFGRLAKCNE